MSKIMGRLMEIARRVIEEQDRRLDEQSSRLSGQADNMKAIIPIGMLSANDLNDIYGQSLPEDRVPLNYQPRRFAPRMKHIKEFARSGKIIPIYLAGIDETILLVADNAPPVDGMFNGEKIAYDASELEAMIGITTKDFRFLQNIKRYFGGKIVLELEEMAPNSIVIPQLV